MLQSLTIHQAPSLKPLTTAHLAQTMSLLELNCFELSQKIQSELARNPALELREERCCPICNRPLSVDGPCPQCSLPKSNLPEEPIVFVSPSTDFRINYDYDESESDTIDERTASSSEDLATYVLRQIMLELDPEDRHIAAFILTNLNDDGLLDISPAEIAHYYHIPLTRVENVRHLIQHADPIGVGSKSPQEALLVQLEVLKETMQVPTHAFTIINDGIELLYHHQFDKLSRLIGASLQETHKIVDFIKNNLNPFPARSHWGDIHIGEDSKPTTYSAPDVIINLLNDSIESPFVVEIISPFSGSLQVNPLFRQALCQAPPEKIEEWKLDLERADLLVKCIQQRAHTMMRLMYHLTKLQRNFILFGDGYLNPITRASIAEELGVHESTISRAVSNKVVQLPNGHLIPMEKFFDRSLQIRTMIKQIIDQEPFPYSDNEIVDILKQKGFIVARRTVAKYRAMEKILPSHLRQKRTCKHSHEKTIFSRSSKQVSTTHSE